MLLWSLTVDMHLSSNMDPARCSCFERKPHRVTGECVSQVSLEGAGLQLHTPMNEPAHKQHLSLCCMEMKSHLLWILIMRWKLLRKNSWFKVRTLTLVMFTAGLMQSATSLSGSAECHVSARVVSCQSNSKCTEFPYISSDGAAQCVFCPPAACFIHEYAATRAQLQDLLNLWGHICAAAFAFVCVSVCVCV